MTEKEFITEIAKRLGILNEKYSSDHEIYIDSYYDIRIVFDGQGNIVKFDSHP